MSLCCSNLTLQLLTILSTAMLSKCPELPGAFTGLGVSDFVNKDSHKLFMALLTVQSSPMPEQECKIVITEGGSKERARWPSNLHAESFKVSRKQGKEDAS